VIIIDLSQTMIASIITQIGNHTNIELKEDLVRHIVLNNIRAIRSKYADHKEVVIACDDRHYWRRDAFPAYKGTRKKDREKSEIDWTALFNTLSTIKEELKEHFPYAVVQAPGAEADDVIATLVNWAATNKTHPVGVFREEPEPVVIISGDKDFVQLHTHKHVQQYDFVNRRQVTADDPVAFLRELVLRGDRGDGIPNVISPANSLIDGIRQNKMTEKRLTALLESDPASYPADVSDRYKLNSLLIDFSNIPTAVQDKVITEYKYQQGKGREKLFNYFVKNKLKHLMEHIGEF